MARKKTPKKAPKTSHPFLKAVLWTLCFLVLLLALDQLALRLKPTTPLLQELQSGYREFRKRLIGQPDQPPLSIEAVIEKEAAPPVSKPATTTVKKTPAKKPDGATSPVSAKPRAMTPEADQYLYVDADGELQFADRLEDIPTALRKGAQPLNN
jgi:hypothetical protein